MWWLIGIVLVVLSIPYASALALLVVAKKTSVLGMPVYTLPLGNVCAFSIRLPGLCFIMFDEGAIETGTDDQLRFVVAHELGHIMLGHFSAAHVFLPFWRKKTMQHEDEADIFARRLTGVSRDVMSSWRL